MTASGSLLKKFWWLELILTEKINPIEKSALSH